MQYRLSLKSLLLLVMVLSVIFMLAAYGLRNQEHVFIVKLTVALLAPCIIFGLFALAYLATLPIGLMTSLHEENNKIPESPFSADRLPDRVVYTDNSSD